MPQELSQQGELAGLTDRVDPSPLAQTSSPRLMDGPTLLLETGAGVPHAWQEAHSREGNLGKEDYRAITVGGSHFLIHPGRAMMHCCCCC